MAKNAEAQSNLEKKKKSDKPQRRGILQNNRPELISSAKSTKDKERMRNHYRREETKETTKFCIAS